MRSGSLCLQHILRIRCIFLKEKNIQQAEAFRKKFIRVSSGETVEKTMVLRNDDPGICMSGFRVRVW